LIGTATYMLGTKLRPPASPPVPPSGWLPAATEPPSWNLIDGVTRWSAAAASIEPRFDSVAGFDHIELASSVAAAPAANALPRPLPLFSWSANAAP
jgi:hypothetical protein